MKHKSSFGSVYIRAFLGARAGKIGGPRANLDIYAIVEKVLVIALEGINIVALSRHSRRCTFSIVMVFEFRQRCHACQP